MFRLKLRSFSLPFLDSVKQVVKKQAMATAAVPVDTSGEDIVTKIAKNLVQNVRNKEVSCKNIIYQSIKLLSPISASVGRVWPAGICKVMSVSCSLYHQSNSVPF